jgi:two-component system sensor histidine kinase MprB
VSLRSKLAIAFAVLAVIVAGLMGILGYTATSNQLQKETDRVLLAQGGGGRGGGGEGLDRRQDASLVLSADGQTLQSRGEVTLPVTDADRKAAASAQPSVSGRIQSIDGTPYRIVTVSPGQSRGALMVARDWSENAAVLRQLATVLSVLGAALAVVAAGIGWMVARRITRPLVRLTETAEHISSTGQVPQTSLDEVGRLAGTGHDEVGRLAGSFSAMLQRLGRSQAEQQRLVQDAGHELRTPLTSLRTNISLLERFDELSPDVRARVLADLKGESRELTGLVNEVLAVAGGDHDQGDPEPVRLADVAQTVATRARRRTGREITLSTDDSQVVASRVGLERAVWNLLDNAAKFDTSGAPIDIRVAHGVVEVLDRGPGIPDDEAPQLFDRFYRPVTSRSLPGSGLGLAIVKDVAESAGGRVFVRPREGGGSVFGMAFD